MRQLASIQKIQEILDHSNADNLEIARIKGWQVIIRKGEFKEGDLCVYCEIDSVMPEKPEFEFLAPRKYRIKTTKLRGEISQGIAFPLSILNQGDWEFGLISISTEEKGYTPSIKRKGDSSILNEINLVPGLDVTEILGVTKYDPPIPACLGGTALGRFFSHSIKTDEERIQNLIDNYEFYRRWYIWTATEKLDGCLDEKTILETEDGEKTIKEICETRYSRKVKTFNLETQKEEFRKILGYSIKEPTSHQWFEIELDNGKKIKITGNHKVWMPELLCWRRVDELVGNEEFLLKN
jgi:hypothetical protein